MNFKRLFLIALIVLSHMIPCKAGDNWIIYSIYDGDIDVVANCLDFVCFQSGTSAYRFDKDSERLVGINTRNGYNGSIVSNVYQNESRGWIAVCYSDNNLDILDTDGNIYNIPNFKDIKIASSREINDVTFYGDTVYVSTDYGYAIYDHSKKAIVESCLLRKKVTTAARVGNKLWVGVDGALYYGDADKKHTSLMSFVKSSINSSGKIKAIDDMTFFLLNDNNLQRVSVQSGMNVVAETLLNKKGVSMPVKDADGRYLVHCGGSDLTILGQDGGTPVTVGLPEEINNVSAMCSDNSRWGIGSNGICKVSLSGDTVMVTGGEHTNLNATTMSLVGNFLYDEINDKLYAMSIGVSLLYKITGSRGYVNVISEDGTISDVTPQDVADQYGKGYIRDIYSPVFDPNDRDTYYIGTWFDGIYKISEGKIMMKYDQNNSPFVFFQNYNCFVPGVLFDSEGNMWVMQGNDSYSDFFVLPSEKVGLDNVSKDDWIDVGVTGVLTPGYASRTVLSKKHDIIVACGSGWNSDLYVLDCRSALGGDAKERHNHGFINSTDGSRVEWSYVYSLYEDKLGNVWVGTNNGVFYFDPSKAFDDDFKVTHVKVETGESGVGDYLLNGMVVSAITSDKDGNMWFGTESNGIYNTNANGTSLLNHYDTSNSKITTNKIMGICANPNKNVLYVGTDVGLLQLEYDAMHQSDGNAVIYPTVVYPDYTGWIKIKNSNAGTYLAVEDSEGNRIYDTELVNGDAVYWNGCYNDGKRVPTGIYTIFMSNDSGVCEKIGQVKIIR